MKDLDTKKMQQAYPEVPESFHKTVTETLDSLDRIKTVRTGKKSKRKKIIALCAAAAILGTFTVTAAATHFFGFVVTHNGSYGLNVKVENSEPPENITKSMNLNFGYLPEKFKNEYESKDFFTYSDGDEYFNAWIEYADSLDDDFLNVIESSETKCDGRKILYLTFKEAENSDRLYYSSLKYFDEYNCVARCNCHDKEELIRITEKLSVEPAPEDQKPADLKDDVYDEAEQKANNGAIREYQSMYDGNLFMQDFFAGRVKRIGVGDTMDFSLADYDQPGVKVKVKVNSIEEREDSSGLEKRDFTDIGELNYVYNMFFDVNGKLIKEEKAKSHDGIDENNLGTINEVTYIRHFYVADVEINSEGDIEDLNKVFDTEIYGYDEKENMFYNDLLYPSGARAMCIHRTSLNRPLSIKKGETIRIKVGFILEDDTADTSYLTFSGIDELEDNYQNYMVKIKK